MTKRIITIAIILALLATILTGCQFVHLNEGREANQVLATISHNGISTNLKQNEMLDYFNSNASNVMQTYKYTVLEAFNYLMEKKIESKYLTLNATQYLSDTSVFPKRAGLLVGQSSFTKAEDALTYGEKYYAIKTINEQIQKSLDGFVAEYKLDAKKAKISKVEQKGIEEIKIKSNTLRDVYYKDDTLDLDTIELEIIYTEESGKENVIIPVIDTMFVTKFDSTKEGKNKLEIGFDRIELDEDGEEIYVQLKAEHSYEVKVPRATKAEIEDENKDEIEDRYIADKDIKEENKYTRMTLDYTGTDKYMKDAYRKLATNLENQYRTLDYFYETGFETVLMSALQYELGEKAILENPISLSDSTKEYDYLIVKNKNVFTALSTDQKKLDKVAELIASNLNQLYYFPSVSQLPDIKDFFYVDQILINFSEQQKAFLKDFIGKDDALNNTLYEMVKAEVKTNESNTKYDVAFDCPKHEGGNKEDKCKYVEENAENEERLCPSIAYIESDVSFKTIFEALESALIAETDSAKRLEIFDDFKYRYNDDPGIMNNNTGYLIPPKNVKSSFYKSFVDLGRKLYEDVADGEEYVGKALIDGKLQYAFTDYGIHILIISKTPFHNIDANANSFSIDEAIDSIGTTFNKNIQNQLKAEVKAKAYTDYVLKLIENKVIENKDIANVDQKKIDKLLKPYKDLK